MTVQQNGKDGKKQTIKTLGSPLKAPDLTLTRMAPMTAIDDPIWKWFNDIRDKGSGVRPGPGTARTAPS